MKICQKCKEENPNEFVKIIVRTEDDKEISKIKLCKHCFFKLRVYLNDEELW